jgi:hypothetical protein
MVAARPQMLLVLDVTSGEEAIAAVAELAPDVLFLDREITHGLSRIQPDTYDLGPAAAGRHRVVWIDLCDSTELPDWKAWLMQRAGVGRDVDDTAAHEEIPQAIVCASTGKSSLSHRLMGQPAHAAALPNT